MKRADVEAVTQESSVYAHGTREQRIACALLALDDAARVAVETWDEIGQEGEPYVERLRAALLDAGEGQP